MRCSTTIELEHLKVSFAFMTVCIKADIPDSAEDILVHSDKENPEWMWGVDITEDGKYLILYVMKDTSRVKQTLSRQLGISDIQFAFQKNLLWVTELEGQAIGPNMKWNKVVNEFEAEYDM